MARIGFDVSMLVYGGSGVATYTYKILEQLLQIDHQNEYHLFYSSLRRPKDFFALTNLKKFGAHIHSLRLPPRLLKLIWGKIHIIPIEWFTGKMDFFHTSDFLRPPLLPGTIGITTLHDLTWKLYPQWHTPDVIKAHTLKLQKTIKYKDLIICSSQNTLKDLSFLYPQTKKLKTFVNYLGVDQKKLSKLNQSKTNELLKKYNIKTPFIVYIGAIEPRKNLIKLIKAFSQLIKIKKYSHYSLVIAGRAGWKNQDVFGTVKQLQIEDKVIFPGYIYEKDKQPLLSLAKCFCYVSLYEGFGIPPLEAMLSGCPVACSQNSSLPEVGGDAVVYINPQKINTITQGIVKAVENPKHYQSLGYQQVKKFSWKKSAKNFLNIINKYD